jgi:hypothetical protein
MRKSALTIQKSWQTQGSQIRVARRQDAMSQPATRYTFIVPKSLPPEEAASAPDDHYFRGFDEGDGGHPFS